MSRLVQKKIPSIYYKKAVLDKAEAGSSGSEVKREFTSDIARFLHLKPILKMDGFRIGFYNYL
ncbi:hypothetical protein J22TS1_15580 [Siminovitchia terrae]|nr:hypothetical protein J22TS1_15580 [Siminovitchia terrae]